ncbi:MAG: hypothetical protein EBQ96_09815 [Proteobacteria bacterium]|nr:hypothetical protein [Pseudomonadota bacterium]
MQAMASSQKTLEALVREDQAKNPRKDYGSGGYEAYLAAAKLYDQAMAKILAVKRDLGDTAVYELRNNVLTNKDTGERLRLTLDDAIIAESFNNFVNTGRSGVGQFDSFINKMAFYRAMFEEELSEKFPSRSFVDTFLTGSFKEFVDFANERNRAMVAEHDKLGDLITRARTPSYSQALQPNPNENNNSGGSPPPLTSQNPYTSGNTNNPNIDANNHVTPKDNNTNNQPAPGVDPTNNPSSTTFGNGCDAMCQSEMM